MSTTGKQGKTNLPGNISLKGAVDPAQVLLVVSPTTVITAPMLGLHLLQASCREAGIKTGVFYANLLYADLIGVDFHRQVARDFYFLLGERLFAGAAFDRGTQALRGLQNKCSTPGWVPDHIWHVQSQYPDAEFPFPVVLPKEELAKTDLEQLEKFTRDWLHGLVEQLVPMGFSIVGCSTTLGGIVPAVALLHCLKKAAPGIITVLGGSLCEEEMAEGVLSLNAGIDYIFSGEGEITFPSFVKQVLAGDLPQEKIIYGQEVSHLDALPLPDYHEYVQQKERFLPRWPGGGQEYALPFETSRGCWYGKCFFCGLNGKKNVFRSKTPDKVLQHLRQLSVQDKRPYIAMADNMMPSSFFTTLVPRLAAENPGARIFYQMKANLTLGQVMALKKAGITGFQVGIESLSASLLRRMNKPYTLRGNMAVLRYARSVGVHLEWTILFGFPGDRSDEYREMLHLLPLIHHLPPPAEFVPLVLYRYSQFQQAPQSFAISHLQPAEAFREIFPPQAEVEKMAYYFSGRFPAQSHQDPGMITALWQEFQAWHQAWATFKSIPLDFLLPTLHVSLKTAGHYVLEDTRGLPGQPQQLELDPRQANLLLVARPLEKVPQAELDWALANHLGIAGESWFVPLATADPLLMQELEKANAAAAEE